MSPEHVRLFVALELPQDVRDELVRWRDDVLRAAAGVRAVAPGSLHVTLCFLGWREEAEIAPIAEACAVVAARTAPRLTLNTGIWLPPRRPRVLAIELADPDAELAAVQSQLSDVLARGTWYEPEARPFLAHVTVGRVGKGARVRPSELPELPRTSFDGKSVVLYRSRLLRGGACYERLATINLASPRP